MTFDTLGVRFDLTNALPAGLLLIGNKAGKCEDFISDIMIILDSGILSASKVAQLRGRLAWSAWSASHVFGRCGAKACRALSNHAPRHGCDVRLDDDTRSALEWWVRFLGVAAPRRVNLDRGEMPVLIFIDGAFEKRIATIGGVLFDPLDGALECFGGQVSPEIVGRWRATGIEQAIGQAEILPATIARIIWRDRLLGRRNIKLIDNDAAREGLIHGRSRSHASAELLDLFWEVESGKGGSSWFDRVLSSSNISDGPSRLDFSLPDLSSAVVRDIPPLPRSLACVARSEEVEPLRRVGLNRRGSLRIGASTPTQRP